MARALPCLTRRLVPVAVGILALGLGFVVFTALGIGGRATPGDGPPATRADADPGTVLDPNAVGRGNSLVARSESIGLRENGGAGDPSAPLLSEKVPFTVADFDRPIASYRRYALRQVERLRHEALELADAVEAGDPAAARARWRSAFATYVRLGGAYGAFGALDGRIAGLPGRLPKGNADPAFTGLNRLALGLWGRSGDPELPAMAGRLVADVEQRLPRTIRTGEITPLDYALRAHEIMEDAQRSALTGHSVPWSDEGVLATGAALDVTTEILRTLQPLLAGQQVDGATASGVARLRATLADLRRSHAGTLPRLGDLSVRERQRLNASTSWLLEQLQHVPSAVETTDPPPIPALGATR